MDALPHNPYVRGGGPTPAGARLRRSRLFYFWAAVMGALAFGALTVSNGGQGVASDTTAGERALSGLQAPGPGAGGKSVGGVPRGEKVVGELGAKAPTTSGTVGSTATGPRPTGSPTVGGTANVAGSADRTNGATPSTPSPSTPTTPPGSPTTTPPKGTPTTTPPKGTPTTTPPKGTPTTTPPKGTPTTTPPKAPTTTAAPRTSPPATGTTAWTPTGPVYWLAADGNDANIGSEGAPWRSFGAALGRLRPGDTLLVKAGTYGTAATGPTVNVEGINGTPAAPITIAAAPGSRVNLIGGGWQVLRVAASSYIDVRGFDVSGSAATDRSTTNGIEVNGAHHVRVIGNVVHDLGGGGINAVRANHVTIDGNRVHNVAMWNGNQSSAISTFESVNFGGGDNIDGFSFYIRNNVAYDNKNLVGPITDGNCIIVDSNRPTGYSGGTYVADNVCYGNGGRGVHVFISDNVLAVNNTVVGNLTSSQMADQGELSAVQSGNVSFRNNLVIPSRNGRGVREYAATSISYSHNLYVGAAPERTGPGDRVVGDAGVGADYVPVAGSPAIDAGTSDGAPSTDHRGRARLGAPDIGAFES